MKRIVFSLFLACYCGLALASITVQVQTPTVQVGRPFHLSIVVRDSRNNFLPDLTPLRNDFSIIGTESNVSYSVVNGQVSSSSEWIILLIAKRTGVLQIPSLQVGQEKSTPVNIVVTQGQPKAVYPKTAPVGTPQSVPQQQQEVMLLTDVSIDNPYVNQQVIYTVKLYNSRRLVDANYQPPQVEDALFIPFGDERHYQTTMNGRVYAVEEQQFALFPQKSGDLTIKAPFFSALVYDVMPSRVSVQGKTISLKVKPIPALNQGKNWLPAKQITLAESYDKNTSSLSEGSTLVRTVTLEAVAVPAQLLPALDFGNSDQFSIYPEKPTESNSFRQQDLIGRKSIQVTYLLNKAGKITIPALNVNWFNTDTGKEEVSSLPAFTINVRAAAGVKTGQDQDSLLAPPSQQPATPATKNEVPQSIKSESSSSNYAWWLAGGFALAWLVTLLAWQWQRPKQGASKQSKSQILKELQEVCLTNKPNQARDALIKWGRMHWPQATLLNLLDLENLVDDPELKQQIEHLSQTLYHNADSQQGWDGQALWQSVSSFKEASVKKEKTNPLPPINRL